MANKSNPRPVFVVTGWTELIRFFIGSSVFNSDDICSVDNLQAATAASINHGYTPIASMQFISFDMP